MFSPEQVPIQIEQITNCSIRTRESLSLQMSYQNGEIQNDLASRRAGVVDDVLLKPAKAVSYLILRYAQV